MKKEAGVVPQKRARVRCKSSETFTSQNRSDCAAICNGPLCCTKNRFFSVFCNAVSGPLRTLSKLRLVRSSLTQSSIEIERDQNVSQRFVYFWSWVVKPKKHSEKNDRRCTLTRWTLSIKTCIIDPFQVKYEKRWTHRDYLLSLTNRQR